MPRTDNLQFQIGQQNNIKSLRQGQKYIFEGMSKLSCLTNNQYGQKFLNQSLNTEDLIRQNEQLKQSLEQLIEQNTQLTQIVEYLSSQHQQATASGASLNQQELQALAHQVIQLQQELNLERQKKHQSIEMSQTDALQTIKIIEQLSNDFQNMQQHYKNQIQKLQTELGMQKDQCKITLSSIQGRFNKNLEDYQSLLKKLKAKDEIIAELENRLARGAQSGKKDLKISTTIQDLRQTLQKQIQQKQIKIALYQDLIKKLTTLLSQK